MAPPGSFDFDLVVIGGGPGGSTAAALARQRGLKVLVVEKEQFPRFHIGESLLPMGNEIMRETGVWPKLEALGAIRKYGALFYSANGEATKEIIFADGLVPGLEYTYQVERAKFDHLLLEHAREVGAEVRERTRATALEAIAGGHRRPPGDRRRGGGDGHHALGARRERPGQSPHVRAEARPGPPPCSLGASRSSPIFAALSTGRPDGPPATRSPSGSTTAGSG